MVLGSSDSNDGFTTEWDFFFNASILSPTVIGSLLTFIQILRYPLASKGYTVSNYTKSGVVGVTTSSSDIMRYQYAANYMINAIMQGTKPISQDKVYEILTGADVSKIGVGEQELLIKDTNGDYKIKLQITGRKVNETIPSTFLYTYKGSHGTASPLLKASDVAAQAQYMGLDLNDFVMNIGGRYYLTTRKYQNAVKAGLSEYNPQNGEPKTSTLISERELLDAFKQVLSSKGYVSELSGKFNVLDIKDDVNEFNLNIRLENITGEPITPKQKLYTQLIRTDSNLTKNVISRLKNKIISSYNGILNAENVRSALNTVAGGEQAMAILNKILQPLFGDMVKNYYNTRKQTTTNIGTGSSVIIKQDFKRNQERTSTRKS
jgi:hypothetical protein